ncbi:hypothetical protein SELMODRAFT_428584 [Selaginella moellendorffii]|uniref:Uncharacterized protein n=1 Tax=Selaginella moellendorffii TaxID=88036 RepID=D8T3B9_SELML|nr:hypothetical protein SELMODRAFT_428584 [Selaginella moellendorffii]
MASFLSLDEEVPSSEDLQEGGAISSGGRLGENAVSTDLGGGRRIHEENRLQRPRAINADPGEIHALIIAALRCSVGEHAIAEIFFCQELDRHLHRVEPGHCRVSSRLASQPDRRHIPIAAPSSNYYNDKPKMVTVLLSQLQDCEEIRQQGYGLLQRPWLIYPPAVVFQPGLERAFCQLKSRFLVFLTWISATSPLIAARIRYRRAFAERAPEPLAFACSNGARAAIAEVTLPPLGDLDNDTLLRTFARIPTRKFLTRAALVCCAWLDDPVWLKPRQAFKQYLAKQASQALLL